jgi:hypothetical protein
MEQYQSPEQTRLATPGQMPLNHPESQTTIGSPLGPTRGSQASVSAALAAVRAAGNRAFDGAVRIPEGNDGNSFVEMAQRDLDAALQLLAERAQYITGANGAAIALRRRGTEDMQCRASTGGNAPELGALFSTEFGLSGESVRARQPLRCNDTQSDERVNHAVCRELGIASVVVMPVVQDDHVLGVFELFSGKANAFGERDLSALRRLSQMVETAVKLAQVSDRLQERLNATRLSEQPRAADESRSVAAGFASLEPVLAVSPKRPPVSAGALPVPKPRLDRPLPRTAQPAAPKKPLLWSATAQASNAPAAVQEEGNHVPPMLRNLAKCSACGFPISQGRELCVECEEKKWRGHLASDTPSQPVATVAKLEQGNKLKKLQVKSPVSGAAAEVVKAPEPFTASEPRASEPVRWKEALIVPNPSGAAALPEVVLSGGLNSHESWFGANKYVLGTILAIGATIAAFVLLH